MPHTLIILILRILILLELFYFALKLAHFQGSHVCRMGSVTERRLATVLAVLQQILRTLSVTGSAW